MKPKKYQDIEILTEVNVSSTSNYSFKGVCNWGRFDYSGGYFFRKGRREDWITWEPPKYFIEQVKRQIGKMARAGSFKFFEYNQDRVKRYENLRYHDPEYVEYLKGW